MTQHDKRINAMDDFYAKFGDGSDLLSVSIDTHTSVTGAGDSLATSELREREALLTARLDSWVDGPSYSERFDKAVREVVEAVVEEIREELMFRESAKVKA